MILNQRVFLYHHIVAITNPKQDIIAAIKDANLKRNPRPHDNLDVRARVYFPPEDFDLAFAENFVAAGGQFHFFDNSRDAYDLMVKSLKTQKWENVYVQEPTIALRLNELNYLDLKSDQDYSRVDVAIMYCEALISETGSVLLSNKQNTDTALFTAAKIQIVIARAEQILETIGDGYQLLKDRYGELPEEVLLMTGPSCTYNIEAKKKVGIYGSSQVHIFLVEKATEL